MEASEVGTSRPSRRARLARECGALAAGLAVAAICLAACGGSSNTNSVSKSTSAEAPSGQAGASATTSTGSATSTDTPSRTSTSTSTSAAGGTSTSAAGGGTSTAASGGTSTAASGGTSTSTKKSTPTHNKKKTPTHAKNPTAAPSYANLPVVTTVTQSYLPAGYNGPSPTNCLQAAGLTRARQGREPGTWEANLGSSSETDSNSIVFLSGPYQDPNAAANYADSLKTVELAASGGVWVASASVRSNLQTPVDNVANCMAQ